MKRKINKNKYIFPLTLESQKQINIILKKIINEFYEKHKTSTFCSKTKTSHVEVSQHIFMQSSLPLTSASFRYLAPIALESCVLIILSTCTSKFSIQVSSPTLKCFESNPVSLSPTDLAFAITDEIISKTFKLPIVLS